jgi:hypothetical protein
MNSNNNKTGIWRRFRNSIQSDSDRKILRLLEGYIPAISSLPPDEITFCMNVVKGDRGNWRVWLTGVGGIAGLLILRTILPLSEEVGRILYWVGFGCDFCVITIWRRHLAARRVVALLHLRLPSTICGCGYYLTEGLKQCPECGAGVVSGGNKI